MIINFTLYKKSGLTRSYKGCTHTKMKTRKVDSKRWKFKGGVRKKESGSQFRLQFKVGPKVLYGQECLEIVPYKHQE